MFGWIISALPAITQNAKEANTDHNLLDFLILGRSVLQIRALPKIEF
jgi:hypothetical protein